MMTIAKRIVPYVILGISQEAFDNIKQTLIDKELGWKYLSKDDLGLEIIIFGSTALRAEYEQSNHCR